jgi:hypothetical protein
MSDFELKVGTSLTHADNQILYWHDGPVIWATKGSGDVFLLCMVLDHLKPQGYNLIVTEKTGFVQQPYHQLPQK